MNTWYNSGTKYSTLEAMRMGYVVIPTNPIMERAENGYTARVHPKDLVSGRLWNILMAYGPVY